jgi:hypothetical protein
MIVENPQSTQTGAVVRNSGSGPDAESQGSWTAVYTDNLHAAAKATRETKSDAMGVAGGTQ